MVVLLLDTELDLGTRISMAEAKDGSIDIARLKLLNEFSGMLTEATKQVGDNLRGIAGLACQVGESSFDATSQVLLAHTKSDGLLLSGLWQIRLERRTEEVGQNTLADVVDLLESILGTLEWGEADELNGLAEFIQILYSFLNLWKTVSNGIRLKNNLEDL